MTDRPKLLLVVLVLLSFTLTTLDSRAGSGSPFDALRSATDAVLGPVDRAVGGAAGSVGGAVSAVADLTDDSELERLREQNARLRRELAEGEDAERRLAEWDALLQLKDLGTYTVVPGRVISLGSSLGFERTVTVDLGSEDGVRTGQTVVSGAGLVGRTVRVGRWTSVVLLVDDPGFGVGARLTRDGTIGLAKGSGGGRLEYTQVEGGRVEVGDALLTTGSDTFVPGVPIGRVVEVQRSAGGLTTTADVEAFADLAALDLVAVVVDGPRDTPRVPIPPATPIPPDPSP